MKIRIMLVAALGVIFASGGVWFVPHGLRAQTNAPATNQKILYYTCPMHPSVKADKPGNCPLCGMELMAVYTNIDASTNSPSNSTKGTNNATTAEAKPKPYPLDTCVVDGMKLDSMGGPYVFVYERQEIKLCCANCKPEFLKDPAKYLKKIQDAEGGK
jgi:YHS domain-containing protein